MADPGVISASKISFYRGCPLAYQFKYLGVDGKKQPLPSSSSAAFGIEIHYMADQLYKKIKAGEIQKGVPKWDSVEKCIGMWKYRWGTIIKDEKCRNIKVNFNSDMEKWAYMWTGVNIMKGFYNKMTKLPWPAETETTYRTEIGNEKILAKIDRLDIREEDGETKHYISDYKTDRSSPERSTFLLHRSPQFTLYSYAYNKLRGENPYMQLIHMRTGKAFRTKRSQGDYEYLEAIVNKVAEEIRADNFIPFFGFHCNMCNYRDSPCREYSMGVDGKLKALEVAMKTSPEISDWISFDLESKKVPLFENILSKTSGWVRSTLDKVFADYLMMKDTLEEIGPDSLNFLTAIKEDFPEDDLIVNEPEHN